MECCTDTRIESSALHGLLKQNKSGNPRFEYLEYSRQPACSCEIVRPVQYGFVQVQRVTDGDTFNLPGAGAHIKSIAVRPGDE